MNRDNSPWGPTPAAELSWSEGDEPYSRRFDDIYFARDHALAESHHVFLAGNGLPARWQDYEGDCFCIAETGFGTGLNFLLTWAAWQKLPTARPRLHYISTEKYPLDRQQLTRAVHVWPSLSALSEELLAAWPGRLRGQHRIVFDAGQVVLDLWWEDATEAFSDLAAQGPLVDAWFLDGFAPARNSAMWQPQLFTAMSRLSRPGATLSTFTAAGAVRRGLQDAGFTMRKTPGFGRKRDALAGTLATRSPAPRAQVTPWDLRGKPAGKPQSALVIGAGLAGATVAEALASRGVQVTVLDAGGIADAASGNTQGVLYTRLSPKHSALTDFALQSFRHASSFFAQRFAQGVLESGRDGELCGSFHQQDEATELALMRERLQGLEDLASVLDGPGAGDKLGLQPQSAGYWFPASGWVNPPAACRALLRREGISVREHCGPLQLTRGDGLWHALDQAGLKVASAELAIVCAGTGSRLLAQLDWLPTQSIRGQTTQLPACHQSRALRAALCHHGYISPARDDIHCIGASFKLHDSDSDLRAAEHRENLERLARALPQLQTELDALDAASLQGRVGFRCASPDYLPIAGPVPERSEFLQAFAALRKNARQLINQEGSYVPGLYVSTAHGSRGLTSTPLCAQVIAASICGEAPPLSRALLRALSPARFLIRDLSRNRI